LICTGFSGSSLVQECIDEGPCNFSLSELLPIPNHIIVSSSNVPLATPLHTTKACCKKCCPELNVDCGGGGGSGVTSISVNGGVAQTGVVALSIPTISLNGTPVAPGSNNVNLTPIITNVVSGAGTNVTVTGFVATVNADVVDVVAGPGITVNNLSGTYTVSAQVVDIIAGSGINVSESSGIYTITSTCCDCCPCNAWDAIYDIQNNIMPIYDGYPWPSNPADLETLLGSFALDVNVGCYFRSFEIYPYYSDTLPDMLQNTNIQGGVFVYSPRPGFECANGFAAHIYRTESDTIGFIITRAVNAGILNGVAQYAIPQFPHLSIYWANEFITTSGMSPTPELYFRSMIDHITRSIWKSSVFSNGFYEITNPISFASHPENNNECP